MKICDAHVHLGKSGPWQPYMDPTIYIDKLLNLFNQHNVEKAVIFPNPNVGDKYPLMNNYISECTRRYPDRLIGFGRVDPRREDSIEELIRMKNTLDLTGVKLHPMVECFRPDHPFFNKFFQKTSQLELSMLVHTGQGFSSPGLILKIAKKHAKLPIILGHLKEASVTALEKARNVYVETSGTRPELIELSVDIDEDRVLFGSDVPYFRYPTQVAIVEAAEISPKQKRKIFSQNFHKLFSRKWDKEP